MRRRELMLLLGGAMTVPLPLALRAQQKAVPVIGILDVGDPAPLLEAFREGLQDKGYVEGQNIRLEIRSQWEARNPWQRWQENWWGSRST
jgi:putative ABC transport system substrate-binding protein